MGNGKKPRPTTDSEKLFEKYLVQNGFCSFDYEPRLRESRRPPDFCLHYAGGRILFQVKQLDSPHVRPDGFFDPHDTIKGKIEEAWRQLRGFQNDCCCIVLCELGSQTPVLDRNFIYGVMLGRLQIVTPFDRDRGPLPESAFTAFSDEGGEMRWESGEPHKANVSAIVVLEQLKVGQMRFLAAPRRARENVSREERFALAWEEVKRARGTKHDSSLRELRVVVYENPYALRPLRPDLFCGPYDERYGLPRNRVKRLFLGREIREIYSKASLGSPLAEIVRKSAKNRIGISKNS
jgi:hypothetical protein